VITLYAYTAGFILDLLVGDPYFMPHPVKMMGKFIEVNERWMRKKAKSKKQMRLFGVLLCVLTVLVSCGTCYGILFGLKKINDIAYYIGVVYFSYACLSTTGLAKEAKMVAKKLKISLEEGRKRVGYIVGRDTSQLSKDEIIKATVETVAENTTDGIVSPLIYLFIGGPVLAIGFKAVSTLDSMVGYRDEKYIDIGRFSAKLDDVLNFIPARISGVLMALCAVLGLDCKNAFKILWRDHSNHLSPNCGWTESAAAGALGLKLGGAHEYFGKTVEKPTIGDKIHMPKVEDIRKMNGLMYATSVLALLLCSAIYLGVAGLL
jgi:adenosylcobinamide-phosphate synthase